MYWNVVLCNRLLILCKSTRRPIECWWTRKAL